MQSTQEQLEKASRLHASLNTLRPFIGNAQLSCLGDMCRGPERQFGIDKIVELGEIVSGMPKTYEQDGKGDGAVIYLHYFLGGCDWFITEKDELPDQRQAFGLADLGFGPELGYISIVELLENGAELDFYYRPRTIAEQTKAA